MHKEALCKTTDFSWVQGMGTTLLICCLPLVSAASLPELCITMKAAIQCSNSVSFHKRVASAQRCSISITLPRRSPIASASQQPGNGAGSEDFLVEACPVPKEQQPMMEFQALQNAFLFDWPRLPLPQFAFRLAGVFAGFFVLIGLPISAVTFSMQDELLQVLAASSIGSGFITLVLVLRLYLGYSHVSNRLLSATVEYEETGWYDGQIWVKTPQMLMRDRLLGTYQVKPTLENLKRAMLGLSGAMAAATVLLVASPPPKAYSAGSSSGMTPPQYAALDNSQATLTRTAASGVEDGDDYWQRVEQYEPWALNANDDSNNRAERPSLLNHLQQRNDV